MTSLDPRFVPQQRVVFRVFALALGAASLVVLLIVFAAADSLPSWARVVLGVGWLAAVVIGAWTAERWPALDYAHAGYQLDDDGLKLRRGVLWQIVTHVPRSRVQHTDVSQGPLERRYGLGTLVVYTAGTSHARVALPGLAHEVARALRDELRAERADDAV
jgi:membrane protein YdbS with pleckstrin-like domain